MEMRDLLSHGCFSLAAFFMNATVHAAVIINEIDYDQPSTDTAEFIELFNTDSATVSLDGFAVELVNGTSGSVYDSFDLSGHSIGAGGYFVLCNDGALGITCQFDVASTASSGWMQNGGSSGDAVALYHNSQLVDSLAYEAINSTLLAFGEGQTHAGEDSSTQIMSLSRITNGLDTNINSSDFSQGCITPGSSNIAGSGDCTMLSAVPVPAAAWLFGSGLLGLVQIARRQTRR